MSAEIRSVTGRAHQPSVPIAQSTERECPKLQVAGEIPAGDTNWERSSTAERSFDMREVKRAARFAPTILRV